MDTEINFDVTHFISEELDHAGASLGRVATGGVDTNFQQSTSLVS